MNPILDPQSSTSASSSTPFGSALQRGKACLSCRRRKMKCDGARPICTPCLRGERAEDCEYTDGQHRSRTLVLEEDVARLRARVQELENPERPTSSIELYNPYASAGLNTVGSTSQSQLHAPGPAAYHYGGPIGQAPSRVGICPAVTCFPAIDDLVRTLGSTTDPLRLDPEADVHVRHALSVIVPYTDEIGFFLDIDRLRVQGTYVLPALQSALTLWSIHITALAEPDHAQHIERTQALTSNILSQAKIQLASALGDVDAEPDPAVFLHVVQTGILLAYFMQRAGQAVGARYYASGTWTLAMMLKLYRSPHLAVDVGEVRDESLQGDEGQPQGRTLECPFAFVGCARLAPALDAIEAEERVRAFWAVYALDRWFSAVGQGPSLSLPMDGNALTVTWPDVGCLDEASNVTQDLFDDPNHDFTLDGPSAMQAKASVLLGEATSIAGLYAADHAIRQSPAFQARFATSETLLQRSFNAAMTMSTERPPNTQGQRQALVALHLIALAHLVLYRPFISTYCPSGRRCADVTLGVVRVLDRMTEHGVRVGYASPLYAIVWTALCLALHDEVLCIRARPAADPVRRREGEVVGAIRKLMGKLSTLSQDCPSKFFASKIEAVLPILESVAV